MISLGLFVVLLGLSQLGDAKWVELLGKLPDGADIRIEIAINDKSMLVVTHKPDHEAHFTETSNLHVFSSHLVAAKDDKDKVCYVQYFNATHDEMVDRIEVATKHHFNLGPVKKEIIKTSMLQELAPESVEHLFGPEISEFCSLMKVYFVDSNTCSIVKSEPSHHRGRRMVRGDSYARPTYIIDDPDSFGPSGGLKIKNILTVC